MPKKRDAIVKAILAAHAMAERHPEDRLLFLEAAHEAFLRLRSRGRPPGEDQDGQALRTMTDMMFPNMPHMIAARALVDWGYVQGGGTVTSRAKRLANKYRKLSR